MACLSREIDKKIDAPWCHRCPILAQHKVYFINDTSIFFSFSVAQFSTVSFFLLKKILFCCTRSRLQHAGSLIFIAACGSLNYTFGVKFPDRGLNLGPLHWEYGVLATGPLGKTLSCFFSNKFLFCIVTCYPSGECIEFPYSMKVCKWKY